MMAVIAIGLGTTQAGAQGLVKNLMSRMYGGPKIEANVSNYFLSGMPGVSSKMNAGGAVGGFLGFRITEHFSVQEDILVKYQTSQLEQNGQKGDFSYFGAELSFYAVGHWSTSSRNRFIIGAGPFVGYGLDAKYKINGNETDLYKKDGNGVKKLQPFDIGVGVMLGYELKCGLQVNASYKIGILDQLSADKSDASMRSNQISLGVAYRFGK